MAAPEDLHQLAQDLGNERGGSFASEPMPPAEPKLGKSDRGMTEERRASTGAQPAPKLDGGVRAACLARWGFFPSKGAIMKEIEKTNVRTMNGWCQGH